MSSIADRVEKSPTGRQARKAATRESLKAAALRCVAERDYAEVQVADITAAAGVAKGTFYVHFATKEALFDELRVEFNRDFVDSVLAIWRRPFASTAALVDAIARQFFATWRTHRDFIKAYAQRLTVGASFEEIRDGVNPEMRAFLARSLNEALAREGRTLRDADLVIQGVLALWMRVGLQVVFGPSRSEEDTAALLTRMTLGAVQAAAEPI